VLVHQGSAIACRIIDLSLGGCQARVEQKFLAGTMVRGEVVFKVLGEAFGIAGVTQRTWQKQWIGIRFLDLSERKSAVLMQLIDDIAGARQRRPDVVPNSAGPAATT
jgi:hypothetical protein